MLKVNYFHICDSAIFDQATGKLSIIGIFSNFNASGFPAMHPIMSIVVGLENKNPGLYNLELEFLDEKDSILKIPAKVQIGPDGRGVWVHTHSAYQIPRELTQKVKLSYEGKTIYETYLTVNNK
ncbi:MAG: hypothetical protein WCW93_02880 [Candidatus Paceibacterota bacterium]